MTSTGKYYNSKEYDLVYRTLVRAARSRETITYKEIAELMGLLPAGNHMATEVGHMAGDISRSEHLEGRPMLSAIVVRSGNGLPGTGFFRLARDLGKLKSSSEVDERQFLEAEREAVYQTWKP